MLRSRSVTGWPHHLVSTQICRVPASTGRSPKSPRPGAAPGRHGAAHGSIHTGDVARQGRHLLCKQSHAGALPAICTRLTRELSRLADNLAAWGAARSRASRPPAGRSPAGARFVNKSAVTKHAGSGRVEHYHRLPPFYHSR
jgi:hypothetical protein